MTVQATIQEQAMTAPAWTWITCVCSKRLCRGDANVTVSVTKTAQSQIAMLCRNCKREVYLGVR